ncbi:TIGR03915 family putative DNA repair protein [Sphingobacterium bovistauri]|uniref:TIGR03915 family putative DNA repair protein n=1 Tax=Sphingobacterium bovistauri TaxID=2781959 RepID=A0ABS7Z0I5_9SPHI|nr:TIGR03915 family putative DNA repair protein [Sphingobacterium bovistauri]MCA5003680.1 TIGR03915 family putative DNA repair protein [Sphingobacterium bovistauri]
MYYIFDGTYYGWLTCVFEAFERKEFSIKPITKEFHLPDIFADDRVITTSKEKAIRIIRGLEGHVGKNMAQDFYRAFLFEHPAVWQAAYYLAVQIFKGNKHILSNFGNDAVMKFSDALRKVSRERHRMKAFVRFQQSTDGLYFAVVEPDFNVLPLIAAFFKNRYTDQSWIIYDLKRNYGIYWDKVNLIEVELNAGEIGDVMHTSTLVSLDDQEEYYKNLWQQYFKSTNIEARRNLKLHLKHVPRRYWKYLPEKN